MIDKATGNLRAVQVLLPRPNFANPITPKVKNLAALLRPEQTAPRYDVERLWKHIASKRERTGANVRLRHAAKEAGLELTSRLAARTEATALGKDSLHGRQSYLSRGRRERVH
jgi:hypothetical protein